LAPEVNEAVETAHATGILSAASLMVNGPAVEDAIARARRMPTLRVGLHLVLVDGAPLLPRDHVPDLLDANGTLRTDLVKLGAEVFVRSETRRQLAAEIAAQFEAYEATGLRLDHVNAHHHFHVHPTITTLILDIGQRFGLRAVRVPAEPTRVLARIESTAKPHRNWGVAPWMALLRRRVRARGLTAADQVFGVAWSGAMTEARVGAILQNLPEGSTEIYFHPATVDRFRGGVAGYRYADELAALIAPRIKALTSACGARLGGFADLCAA